MKRLRDPRLYYDLGDLLGYAAQSRVKRFVVAPEPEAEYALINWNGNTAYRLTTNKVVTFSDAHGRPRVKIPFRAFGHFFCTEPERMEGLAWCLDVLKSGHLFVHHPSRHGTRQVLLPRLMAQLLIERCHGRRPSTLRCDNTCFSTLASMTSFRTPQYEPKPDRVLMVTVDLRAGGSERQLLATATGLIARGYEVKVLIFNRLAPERPNYEQNFIRLGVKAEVVSDYIPPLQWRAPSVVHSAVAGSLPEWLLSRIDAIKACIHHYRPGVLHCWSDFPSICGGLAGCGLGVPRIISRLGSTARIQRDSANAEVWRQAYRLIASNRSVVLLNNSRAGAHDYEHWIGLRQGTISTLQNAFLPESAKMPDHAETERFRQSLGLRDGSPIVGTLMRFVPEKDPLLWLETAAQISRLRPDVRFLIGGYGNLGPEMEHRIKERDLGGSVVLAGPIADPGLAYSVMDTVLLTSMVEGIPNVAIEAQAMGRPVVVTNVGGAPEAVLANRTGIVVSERSAEALAKAVINTLDDPCWRNRVSSEGPKFVSARFALARMIDETLDHYGRPRSLFN